MPGISRDGIAFKNLPLGASIGTNSVRRRALLLRARPDLKIFPMRGNVDTRLAKLSEGAFDGLVLACHAGNKRLGMARPHHTETLSLEPFYARGGSRRAGRLWFAGRI